MVPVVMERDDDALLTYEQVADWLQVSERKVEQLVKGERPLPIRRIGFQPRVRVGDLRQWIRQTPIVGT